MENPNITAFYKVAANHYENEDEIRAILPPDKLEDMKEISLTHEGRDIGYMYIIPTGVPIALVGDLQSLCEDGLDCMVYQAGNYVIVLINQ